MDIHELKREYSEWALTISEEFYSQLMELDQHSKLATYVYIKSIEDEILSGISDGEVPVGIIDAFESET